jgi:non-ribosomal peptide synthetase-like protein
MPDGTRWLGSPSFLLPRTQQDAAFADSATYRPTRALVAQRLLIDALRIVLPGFIAAGALVILAYGLWTGADLLPLPALLAAAPLLLVAAALSAALAVVAVKWLLMGTYRPTVQPLWSMYVWLNEVVNAAYEAVATPLIEPLGGTPFLPAYLRLLGCKVGRWTYIDTTLFLRVRPRRDRRLCRAEPRRHGTDAPVRGQDHEVGTAGDRRRMLTRELDGRSL